MAVRTADFAGMDFTISPGWRNGTRNQLAAPELIARPRDEDEIVRLVKIARDRGLTVRPVGGGWSWMPLVPTGGIIIDFQNIKGVISVDLAARRARVKAGTRIHELNDALWDRGAALIQLGAWSGQTIAGAVGTGTHGTGIGLGNIESYVRGIRLVDGRGEIVELGEADVEALRAARVSLGLMGVITEIELEITEAYELAADFGFHPWEEAQDRLFGGVDGVRHLASLWAPHDSSFESVQFPAPPGMRDHFFLQRYWEPRPGDTYVDRSYRIIAPSPLLVNVSEYVEMEYGVPVERGEEAASATRELIREQFPYFVGPMYNRFIKGDDAYLSPFFERDSMTVSLSSSPLREYWPVFEAVHQLLVDRFDARPHWGKLNFFEADEIEKAFPRYRDFVSARRQADPDGVFLNEYTRKNFS